MGASYGELGTKSSGAACSGPQASCGPSSQLMNIEIPINTWRHLTVDCIGNLLIRNFPDDKPPIKPVEGILEKSIACFWPDLASTSQSCREKSSIY